MKPRIFCAALFAALATTAFADDARWVNAPVRISFGAEHTLVGGRITKMDVCLYVKLDRARDGITLIRLDQVTQLQSRSGTGWVVQDLQLLLRQEPKHCFDEANG